MDGAGGFASGFRQAFGSPASRRGQRKTFVGGFQRSDQGADGGSFTSARPACQHTDWVGQGLADGDILFFG